MKRYAQKNSSRRKIWLITMILSMLFVQSLQVHVHTYNHDADLAGDSRYDMAHSVFILSDAPHENEVAQLDMSHSGLLSKISFAPLMAAILISLLLMVCSRCCIRLARQYQTRLIFNHYNEQLRPPLRAPPLH
ncbi:MAG: hypothetical protein OQL06_12070 [Gammaproteobacteria bacterium]|nr:hypothetical protein [Gammaproteobacteria bacterium]